jgi:hypothetical protein
MPGYHRRRPSCNRGEQDPADPPTIEEIVAVYAHNRPPRRRPATGELGRYTFAPGWRWSNDVKPIAGTHSCEAPRFQYHVSGQLAIRMDDGTEFVAGPGEITSLPSGHDAWVVGEQPVVVIDWYGASNYARHS